VVPPKNWKCQLHIDWLFINVLDAAQYFVQSLVIAVYSVPMVMYIVHQNKKKTLKVNNFIICFYLSPTDKLFYQFQI